MNLPQADPVPLVAPVQGLLVDSAVLGQITRPGLAHLVLGQTVPPVLVQIALPALVQVALQVLVHSDKGGQVVLGIRIPEILKTRAMVAVQMMANQEDLLGGHRRFILDACYSLMRCRLYVTINQSYKVRIRCYVCSTLKIIKLNLIIWFKCLKPWHPDYFAV